jgi:hypothetical protein
MSMRNLVSIEKLSEQTGFPVRLLRTWAAGKKIPYFKFGHRTMRFDPGKVVKALEKFEVQAIGAKNT